MEICSSLVYSTETQTLNPDFCKMNISFFASVNCFFIVFMQQNFLLPEVTLGADLVTVVDGGRLESLERWVGLVLQFPLSGASFPLTSVVLFACVTVLHFVMPRSNGKK